MIFRDRIRIVAPLALAALPLLFSGCNSVEAIQAGGTTDPSASATMHGAAHGGYNFIGGAIVTLYEAGTSGYGAGAVAVAHAPTSTLDGSFSFSQVAGAPSDNRDATYQCPTGSDPQMYLVSRGGDTSGSGLSDGDQNTATVLITLLGPCSTDSQRYVTINEASTVAAVFAMQQFMNVTPTDVLIGTDGSASAATGLTNAYATFLNLVDPSKGVPLTTVSPSSTVAGVTMTGTPEYQKVVTLSNILANCVNQATYDDTDTTSACYNLMIYAVPPTYATNKQAVTTTAAQDVANAAYYLAINPTQAQDGAVGRNANLYNIQTGYAPYGPGLAAAPSDWTLAITYTTGSTTCTGTSGVNPFGAPTQMAIDSNGDIWVTNGLSTANNALVEVSPSGGMIGCIDGTFANGNGIVVDKNNDVWYTAEGNTGLGAPAELMEYKGSGNPVAWTLGSGVDPYLVTTDTAGDILMTAHTASGGVYLPQLYPGAANATSVFGPSSMAAATGPSAMPCSLAVSYYGGATTPYLVAPDSAYVNVFAAPGSNSYTWNYVDYTSSGEALTQRVASDRNGNIVGASGAGSASPASTWFTTVPASSSQSVTVSTQFLGGLNSSGGVAVDGNNYWWSALNLPSTAGGSYGFAETIGGTTALSPSADSGFSASSCSSTSCPAGGSFQRLNVAAPMTDIAIDPSGNVWATMNSGSGGPLSANGLVEVVGAAAPVVTPLVNSLP